LWQAAKAGGAGALVSLPYVGPVVALYYLGQFYEAYRAGQLDSLSGWELATYIAAGIALRRFTPDIIETLSSPRSGPTPSVAPPIKIEVADTVTGPRISVNLGGQQIIVYADQILVEGDAIRLKNVDVGSNLTNQVGIPNLRAIAKGFADQYGVKKVIVEGGVRTTGANPGRAPTFTFDFSDGK
jgi:hypothetical protein